MAGYLPRLVVTQHALCSAGHLPWLVTHICLNPHKACWGTHATAMLQILTCRAKQVAHGLAEADGLGGNQSVPTDRFYIRVYSKGYSPDGVTGAVIHLFSYAVSWGLLTLHIKRIRNKLSLELDL